ncbi:MAG: carbamoyltransferase HypF [Planctomycetaceae bacterium]|nr:carbamoyltransferase HypF [Planctomycetaceae bacterium]
MSPSTIVAVELLLTGQVQGRGVRPAIARLAASLRLAGDVRNTLKGLSITLEGVSEAINRFCESLPTALPSGCQIIDIQRQDAEPQDRDQFHIRRDDNTGPLTTPVPVDTGVCPQCLDEVADSHDRRHLYPLTTCAACGPRWTVIREMPYERDYTTLDAFPLCADCRKEYTSPDDRRFHAQTIGCEKCGPRVWAVDAKGQHKGRGAEAIQAAISSLRQGHIIALRGVGGYQLLCDATNDTAVSELRKKKGRPAKPLAILVENALVAQDFAELSAKERKELESPANPIVLCRSRGTGLSDGIHPGLTDVGVMLPSTPLHAMLAQQFGGPIVCTSGNLEGEPIVVDPKDAEQKFGAIAELIVHHDRPIVRSIDDSVVRFIAGCPVTIRLARGLAPLSLPLDANIPVMAFGGHQKVACAWSNGTQAVLGPHIGDLETVSNRERFLAQVEDAQQLYRFQAERFACDQHPEYWTAQQAAEWGDTVRVQHHLAHVAAGMVEHQLLDHTVLGVAWDGTGYGTDGTIWGGEFLRVHPNFEFDRVAHLRPFQLPGGEAAIREPWRVAMFLLIDALGPDESIKTMFPMLPLGYTETVRRLIGEGQQFPKTTSAGRLFDAAAAMTLPIDRIEYDGQPAMLLEAIADRSAGGSYRLAISDSRPIQLDWRPMFQDLWKDRLSGTSPSAIAMRFHRTLARGILDVANRFGSLPVVLCGGVFQNRLLTELIVELAIGTLPLKLPGRIPPNDGGLAAGQLAVAIRRLKVGSWK